MFNQDHPIMSTDERYDIFTYGTHLIALFINKEHLDTALTTPPHSQLIPFSKSTFTVIVSSFFIIGLSDVVHY